MLTKHVSPANKCPICQSKQIRTFLQRTRVPVHQNLVMRDRSSALELNHGSLELGVCEECGFIFNHSFEFDKLSYGDTYDNTQACSSVFDNYLDHLAKYMVVDRGVRNCRIVEVGCGKGLFLRKLVAIEGSGNIGHGFDPSYIGPTLDMQGRLRFEKRYYDSTCGDIQADVVVCRHVIEHIPQPLMLLHAVRHALSSFSHAKIFFETPCVEWILANQVIWDFFYEHCSYFTAQSLSTAFESSGFKVENVQHVFGGQYLWLEATVAPEHSVVTKNAGPIPLLTQKFASAEAELKRIFTLRIQELLTKNRGNVALWGAGAKGVTFAGLIDPECHLIACVVDLNPQKQGCYLPGTGHPIVHYSKLPEYGVSTAILMNPNYYTENVALLENAGIKVQLVNLHE